MKASAYTIRMLYSLHLDFNIGYKSDHLTQKPRVRFVQGLTLKISRDILSSGVGLTRTGTKATISTLINKNQSCCI